MLLGFYRRSALKWYPPRVDSAVRSRPSLDHSAYKQPHLVGPRTDRSTNKPTMSCSGDASAPSPYALLLWHVALALSEVRIGQAPHPFFSFEGRKCYKYGCKSLPRPRYTSGLASFVLGDFFRVDLTTSSAQRSRRRFMGWWSRSRGSDKTRQTREVLTEGPVVSFEPYAQEGGQD